MRRRCSSSFSRAGPYQGFGIMGEGVTADLEPEMEQKLMPRVLEAIEGGIWPRLNKLSFSFVLPAAVCQTPHKWQSLRELNVQFRTEPDTNAFVAWMRSFPLLETAVIRSH